MAISYLDAALNAIRKERERQLQLWGAQDDVSTFGYISILGEEYGELCEAINETHFFNAYHPDRGGYANIIKEATQVAAVAVAISERYRRLELAQYQLHLANPRIMPDPEGGAEE